MTCSGFSTPKVSSSTRRASVLSCASTRSEIPSRPLKHIASDGRRRHTRRPITDAPQPALFLVSLLHPIQKPQRTFSVLRPTRTTTGMGEHQTVVCTMSCTSVWMHVFSVYKRLTYAVFLFALCALALAFYTSTHPSIGGVLTSQIVIHVRLCGDIYIALHMTIHCLSTSKSVLPPVGLMISHRGTCQGDLGARTGWPA